jgi:hypothetical protein
LKINLIGGRGVYQPWLQKPNYVLTSSTLKKNIQTTFKTIRKESLPYNDLTVPFPDHDRKIVLSVAYMAIVLAQRLTRLSTASARSWPSCNVLKLAATMQELLLLCFTQLAVGTFTNCE